MKKIIMNSKLGLFVIGVFILVLQGLLFGQDEYLVDDYITLKERYNQSQYVMGEGSPVIISDSDTYAYAGYEYIRGVDPTHINFEHPPL